MDDFLPGSKKDVKAKGAAAAAADVKADAVGRRGGLFSLVDDEHVPRVENNGKISALARRFGEVVNRLPMFLVNDVLVAYDHRRERRPMTGRRFRSWIEQRVQVVGGYDAKSGSPVEGSLGVGDCFDILESDCFLQGVREILMEEQVRLPVVREGGELEQLPWGYDERTKVFTIPGGVEYDLNWDVSEGKRWFEDWFGGMPFHDDRSKAVMIAGLLVLFVRHLPGGNGLRPGFLWEANTPGSGKSVCGKACCSIVLGRAPVGSRKGREEMDKEIAAHLKSKSPVIFLDNLKGNMRSATLDQLITSKLVTFRAMGGQTIVEMENDAPVFLTGNDLEKDEDAHRRFLQCYLFEKGDPNKRKVRKLLSDTVMRGEAWRKDALSALWSFVKCWDDKGRPDGPTTLGSFEEFSRLIGGIVTACGYHDPIERADDEDGMSPERADFIALCRGMYEEMREEGVDERLWGFDDMARVARKLDVFNNVVGDLEMGKRETIRVDKPSMEDRAFVEDRGLLTQQQLQPWQNLIKSKVGTEPSFDGVRLVFGDLKKEKRKVKFTVRVVERGA